jgi:hypothetical protein
MVRNWFEGLALGAFEVNGRNIQDPAGTKSHVTVLAVKE